MISGGGIGGLATAFYLSRTGVKTVLLEASPRLGGWIKSITDPSGTVLETGPRTIRVVGQPGNII